MEDDVNLRRHPEGRAHEGIPLAGGVGELASHSEVRQLHVSHVGQQHVCGLDITVQLPLLVQVLKALYHFPGGEGEGEGEGVRVSV